MLFASCAKKQENDGPLVINLEKNISNFKKVHLSNIAEDVRYILLETNNESFIEDIRNLDIDSDYIFVSARGKCILFDSKGKFVSKIGKKGKGPGEYIYPSAVKIGKKVLFVPSSENLLIYSKTGEFLQSVKNPAWFDVMPFNDNWFPITDSLFICQVRNVMGDEASKAVVFNINSDTIQLIPNYIKFSRSKISYRSDDGRAKFYLYKNLLSYREYMNDTLFRFRDNYKLEPSYIFSLGKYQFPPELRGLPTREYVEKFKKYIWIYDFFETNNFFFFNLSFGIDYPFKTQKEYIINGKTTMGIAPVLAVFNKINKETFIIQPSQINDGLNPNGIENDWDGGMNFFPQARINDSTLLMSFLPFQLKIFVKSEAFKNSTPKYPEKKKVLEELANSLDENDNPVLMLVKLKEYKYE